MAIGTTDLVILIAYLIATVAFGLYMGRGQKSATDYLLGGRNLPWWVLLLSIVATETSTATFLSVPGIAFGTAEAPGNLLFLQLPLGYLVGRTIAAYGLLPLYFKGKMFTAYDVLNQRSGPHVRSMASALFLITRTLGDGLRLYLAAVVMQIMFDCSLATAVVSVGIATVIYTVIGGIKAVVWTDAIQFVVYMTGAVIAFFVMGNQLDGGLAATFQADAMQERLRCFDFGFDFSSPYTFWAGMIGGAVLSIGSHGVDQMIVQRYLCARSQRDAQKALLWSGPVVLVQFAIFLMLGLGLSAFYTQHPTGEPFESGDRVLAHFIVHHLPVGLIGIVLGAVFSAAMSTLSSSLSASASAVVNDFILPRTGHDPDSPFALRSAKMATIVFAGMQILVGISGLGGASSVVGQVLTIQTLTLGVILGLFVLALSEQRSAKASLIGLVCGLLATVLIVFVMPLIEIGDGKTLKIGWPWYGLITCSATYGGGRIARFILARI